MQVLRVIKRSATITNIPSGKYVIECLGTFMDRRPLSDL
jgi:hypothetical protein